AEVHAKARRGPTPLQTPANRGIGFRRRQPPTGPGHAEKPRTGAPEREGDTTESWTTWTDRGRAVPTAHLDGEALHRVGAAHAAHGRPHDAADRAPTGDDPSHGGADATDVTQNRACR